MYRKSAHNAAMQSMLHRGIGARRCDRLVIAFRRGRDNLGTMRVYRRVYTHTYEDEAQKEYARLCDAGPYGYVVIIDPETSELLEAWGCEGLADEWIEQRKGVNRDVDWKSAAGYVMREVLGDKKAKDTHWR